MTAALGERIGEVRERIAAAGTRVGRSPDDVTLVGVSKTFSADVVKAAVEAGLANLGENRAQELAQKVAVLGPLARWHFIGPLQSNKVRLVVGAAALIHSVDRFGLAEAIGRRAVHLGIVQDVLIEVNIAGERSKHGIEPARAAAFAEEVTAIEGVRLRGLMTMAPFADDPASSRPWFRELRALGEQVRTIAPAAVDLSMGMSRDYPVAVEEGATIVRVGEAIFGSRR